MYLNIHLHLGCDVYLKVWILFSECNGSFILLSLLLLSFGEQVVLEGSKGIDDVSAKLRVNVLWGELSCPGPFARPVGHVAEHLWSAHCKKNLNK